MGSSFKNPQEKKALSYERDRRNVYGQNSKASRKAIPARKASVRRAFRHETNQMLKTALRADGEEQLDTVEAKVISVARKRWRKCPDAPLKKIVSDRLARRDIQEQIAREAGVRRSRKPRARPTEKSAGNNDFSFSYSSAKLGEKRTTTKGGTGWAFWQKGEITARHEPSGLTARAAYPGGIYTNRELNEIQEALREKLIDELKRQLR